MSQPHVFSAYDPKMDTAMSLLSRVGLMFSFTAMRQNVKSLSFDVERINDSECLQECETARDNETGSYDITWQIMVLISLFIFQLLLALMYDYQLHRGTLFLEFRNIKVEQVMENGRKLIAKISLIDAPEKINHYDVERCVRPYFDHIEYINSLPEGPKKKSLSIFLEEFSRLKIIAALGIPVFGFKLFSAHYALKRCTNTLLWALWVTNLTILYTIIMLARNFIHNAYWIDPMEISWPGEGCICYLQATPAELFSIQTPYLLLLVQSFSIIWAAASKHFMGFLVVRGGETYYNFKRPKLVNANDSEKKQQESDQYSVDVS